MDLTIYYLTEFFLITVAASIFMPRPPAELELQTNFNAISKNVKILKIGPVEQKLLKIRQTVGVKIRVYSENSTILLTPLAN